MVDEPRESGVEALKRLSSEEPEASRVFLTVVRIQENAKTARVIAICVASVLVAGLISWAIIRIYTHEFWIEIIGALLGPTGVVTTFLAWLVRRTARKFDKALKRIPEATLARTDAPKEKPP
ncbi:MAG TPA: hypothetical protein DDY78_14075 [Planctomycetales bacterium]|jgi:Flp pilus assembly protein TadB|nr:hypothetical protein [Planctomycetales bacterium]